MSNKTAAAAAEYLRLALPFMSRFDIPVTPENYAVWYEYVSGTNAELKETLDKMLEDGAHVDESATRELYEHHVEPHDAKRFSAVQQSLRTLVDSVTRSLEAANGEVNRYESSLQECSKYLTEDLSIEQIRSLVSDLATSTKSMNDGNDDLMRHLEESQREAESLRQELEQAKVEAKTDALTGLANRKAFDERVKQMHAENEQQYCVHSLMIADIDKFKSVNDTYGHLFGDKVIKTVAGALQNLVKGKDMAARFGGEEFVILLPDTAVEDAAKVADAIRKSIETGRVVKPKTKEEVRRVTISIGVTEIGRNEDIKECLARADDALYRAKENGRNRVEVNPLAQPQMVAL